MTTAERIAENDRRIVQRINKEIDDCKMAYKVKDCEGNIFVYGGLYSGFPWFRGHGGSKHIFDLNGYEVLEQHIKM